MLIVIELHVGEMELAALLDVNLTRAIDHDVGHRVVAQQRFQRAEAEQLVLDLLHQTVAIDVGEKPSVLAENVGDRRDDLGGNQRGVERFQLRDVDRLEEPVVNFDLEPARAFGKQVRFAFDGGSDE